MSREKSKPVRWSSRLSYVLAATGAAVGLGNIWKFPYIMGENGGGAFVLVYLACILFIGIPIMMAEVMIGKFGRQTPARSARLLADAAGAGRGWSVVGWFGVLTGFLILSFYVVIAGWALAYTYHGFVGTFNGQDADQIAALFADLNREPTRLMGWSTALLAATVVVVGNGVRDGLERAVNGMMPMLFILLVIMVIYAYQRGNFAEAYQFMFNADFSKLSWRGVMVALGHSFFTLSLASGIMTMYGAYLPDGTSLVKTSLWIAFMDTLVAMLAGLAIYPIVFGHGLAPGAGPGLIFMTLPIAFGEMPFGQLFGGLFFLMLVVAAFTSALALIESSVAWLVERHGFGRMTAALLAGAGIWLVSQLTVFSLTGAAWTQFTLGEKRLTLFDGIDFLTSSLMLPLGGLMIALFVGYVVSRDLTIRTLETSPKVHKIWRLCVRYIAPVAVSLVFLQQLGVVAF